MNEVIVYSHELVLAFRLYTAAEQKVITASVCFYIVTDYTGNHEEKNQVVGNVQSIYTLARTL